MLKWVITVFVVLALLAVLTPHVRRLGLGRLPGDIEFPARGRIYYIPLASTVVLSILVWLVGRFI